MLTLKNLLDLVLLEFLPKDTEVSGAKHRRWQRCHVPADVRGVNRERMHRLRTHQFLQANHFAVGHASRIWPRQASADNVGMSVMASQRDLPQPCLSTGTRSRTSLLDHTITHLRYSSSSPRSASSPDPCTRPSCRFSGTELPKCHRQSAAVRSVRNVRHVRSVLTPLRAQFHTVPQCAHQHCRQPLAPPLSILLTPPSALPSRQSVILRLIQ